MFDVSRAQEHDKFQGQYRCSSTLAIHVLCLCLVLLMSEAQTKADAQQGIPAVDPAAVDQGQYGSLAQGCSVGAGSGAAFGGAVGAAGGPVGSVIGAAVGGLAGAVAGGAIAAERGPAGSAVDMKPVAETTGNQEKPGTEGARGAQA